MSYHQDWLMRQIETIIAMLGFLLFGKADHAAVIAEHEPGVSGENELYIRLRTLVLQKEICQAENILYEALEDPSRAVLDAARQFYEDLNRLTDDELRQCDFSREEILSGLQDVCRRFGLPEI